MFSAFKNGAQSKVVVRSCYVTIELGLFFVFKTCVRRRQGSGAPVRKRAPKAWFLAAPENPTQPGKTSCTDVWRGQDVTPPLTWSHEVVGVMRQFGFRNLECGIIKKGLIDPRFRIPTTPFRFRFPLLHNPMRTRMTGDK